MAIQLYRGRRSRRGLSLVETMLGFTVGSMALMMTSQFFVWFQGTANLATNNVIATHDMRDSLRKLTRTIRHANTEQESGFYEGYALIGATEDGQFLWVEKPWDPDNPTSWEPGEYYWFNGESLVSYGGSNWEGTVVINQISPVDDGVPIFAMVGNPPLGLRVQYKIVPDKDFLGHGGFIQNVDYFIEFKN